MLGPFQKKIFIIVVILALIVIIIFFIPIEFTYQVKAAGKILPAKSWIVSKGNSGQIITFLQNREKGIVDNYSVKEFERGDNIHLSLMPDFAIGTKISEKDTVGFIYSNEIERQITELKSQLDIAKTSLDVVTTGEKESIIKEAEENLQYQLRQAADQEKILSRWKALYEKDLASQEEYELILNQAELSKILVDAARARLQSVATGAKEEEIRLIRNQIKSLENQLEVLRKRSSSYNLISPIGGIVSNVAMGDTLFIVSENTGYVVFIPVKLNYVEYVKINSEVELDVPRSSKKLTGFIKYIDNSATYLNGEQIVWAIASLRTNQQITEGLMVKCSIDAGTTKVYNYFSRLMNRDVF